MSQSQFLIELTVLILAIFLGVEVISKVPTLLHTPLMSGTNAIHGIVLVGAIVVAGLPHQVTWIRVVALAAVALASTIARKQSTFMNQPGCGVPVTMIAPTITMPWIAFVPDISGVCRSVGTFEITSKPRKIASIRIVSSVTS